jgi:uncharacterized protein (TIGR01244 family)
MICPQSLPFRVFSFLFLFLLCLFQAQAAVGRNAEWAVPIASPSVPNLFRVTPDIYRSAQPEAADMKALEQMGIRTVISLRGFHGDREKAKGTKLVLISIPIHTWDIDDDEVIQALRALRDAEKPVLLHCQHGADRTGLIMAMYRMTEQGWSREKALDELQNGGYGFHPMWQNIIEYLRKIDVERIRAVVKAGHFVKIEN